MAVAEQQDVAAGSRRRAMTRSARAPTSATDSPPGQPSRNRYQSGRSARISAVRRPSYAP